MSIKQPTVKPRPLVSWSFSRYRDYVKCPEFFKHRHIEKITEPPNDAMARGSLIHKSAEDYLKGKIARLPKELVLLGPEFKKLRALYKKRMSGMVVEDTWAFTRDWDQTVYNDWVGCWLRVKLDCAHVVDGTTMIVTDWKTGKFRPLNVEEYAEQLELYALTAMLLNEHIEEVRPRLAYIDAGIFYPEEGQEKIYTRADIPKLTKLWERRVKPMFKDARFRPKPSSFCRWCFYRASNKANGGGQCQY